MAAVGVQLSAPLAHAGHWLVDLLYLVPVVVIVAVLVSQALRDRRALRRGDAASRRPPDVGAPPG